MNSQSESQLASFKYQTKMHTFVCQKTDKYTFNTVLHNSPEMEAVLNVPQC